MMSSPWLTQRCCPCGLEFQDLEQSFCLNCLHDYSMGHPSHPPCPSPPLMVTLMLMIRGVWGILIPREETDAFGVFPTVNCPARCCVIYCLRLVSRSVVCSLIFWEIVLFFTFRIGPQDGSLKWYFKWEELTHRWNLYSWSKIGHSWTLLLSFFPLPFVLRPFGTLSNNNLSSLEFAGHSHRNGNTPLLAENRHKAWKHSGQSAGAPGPRSLWGLPGFQTPPPTVWAEHTEGLQSRPSYCPARRCVIYCLRMTRPLFRTLKKRTEFIAYWRKGKLHRSVAIPSCTTYC